MPPAATPRRLEPALAPRLFPQGKNFALDFHALPFRGVPPPWTTTSYPAAARQVPVSSASARPESESRVLCHANANLTRADQPGERMRFVEFWQGLTGRDPEWLDFDSKVVPDPELSRVNRRGLQFVTIRRRGAAVIRRLRRLPPQTGQLAVIDTPKRGHQPIRFVDEMIRLPGYEGAIRPRAVDGLGREQPTWFVSHDLVEAARSLLIR